MPAHSANQSHNTPDDEAPKENHEDGHKPSEAKSAHHSRSHHTPASSLPAQSASPEQGYYYQYGKDNTTNDNAYLKTLIHDYLPSRFIVILTQTRTVVCYFCLIMDVSASEEKADDY